jgi:heat shock protein HtpX
LYTSVENLCIASGLPLPKIYVINDSSPNAFATGRNPNNSAVAFTTGLLAILEKNELEGVIAHELAHIKNRDILLQSVIVVLVGLITLVADFFLRATFYSGNRDTGKNGFLLAIGIILIIVSPIIASFIQLAISRKREFLADSTGALMTRYPEGLSNALKKISESPISLKRANHATAHLYISDPFKDELEGSKKKKKINFFHKIFLTHPPIEERVEALIGKRTSFRD